MGYCDCATANHRFLRERTVPPGPREFSYSPHSQGKRDGKSANLLGRHRSRHLPGGSSQGSWWQRSGSLFRGPSHRRASGLRSAHVPTGCDCHGHPYAAYRTKCPRRHGPARNLGNLERSAGRVRNDSGRIPSRRSPGNGRPIAYFAGENRTILRGPTDTAAPAEDYNRLDCIEALKCCLGRSLGLLSSPEVTNSRGSRSRALKPKAADRHQKRQRPVFTAGLDQVHRYGRRPSHN